MFVSADKKTIEIRIGDKEVDPALREIGIKPGVFPDQIIVKQRKNIGDAVGEDERVVYVRKEG